MPSQNADSGSDPILIPPAAASPAAENEAAPVPCNEADTGANSRVTPAVYQGDTGSDVPTSSTPAAAPGAVKDAPAPVAPFPAPSADDQNHYQP